MVDRSLILIHVGIVFKDVFGKEPWVLTEEMTADDIEDWDSLRHIQVVVALEKLFKIRFSAKEMKNWHNVGDLVNSIQGKKSKSAIFD